jgi:DNA-binding transcriptional LysR family regulator
MAISLRQFRYFIAAAEGGSVTRAAFELGVSQSALTAAIKSLEGEIGAKLFTRHGKGVKLTFEGSQFLQHARNVMAAVLDATQAARQAPTGVEGRFSLAVTYTVAGYFLAAALARFRRLFPGVSIELHEMHRIEIEERLIDGSIDIGVILISNLARDAQIDTDLLIQSRRRLWLPSNHPLLHAKTILLRHVAPEPYIMLLIDEADETAMQYWHRARLQPNIVFRTSSVEAVRSMVANGQGVAILSDMVYRPWSLEGGRIEARSLNEPVPSMDVGLVWKRAAQINRAAQAFREFCHAMYNSAGAGVD